MEKEYTLILQDYLDKIIGGPEGMPKCRNCKEELKKETDESLLEQGYVYVCDECEENFFGFEAIE